MSLRFYFYLKIKINEDENPEKSERIKKEGENPENLGSGYHSNSRTVVKLILLTLGDRVCFSRRL